MNIQDEADCPPQTTQREKTGKELIRDQINAFRLCADHLETLHQMLPEQPTPEQNRALQAIATALGRR